MRLVSRRAVLGMVGITPLAGCYGLGENLGTYHFRLTVEIDTPEGIKTGSSVLAVRYGTTPTLQGSMATADLHGEAVFISLGNNKSVIALLTHGPKGEEVNQMGWLPVSALTGAGWGGGSLDELRKRGGRLEGKAELKPPLIPTLVTFTDLNDPKTARVVYATGIKVVCGTRDPDPRNASGCAQFRAAGTQTLDRLSETFGPGYAFKRATLEMVSPGIWPLNLIGITGTPVTRGIEGKLPFLVTHREKLRNQRTAPNDPYTAQFHNFIRE